MLHTLSQLDKNTMSISKVLRLMLEVVYWLTLGIVSKIERKKMGTTFSRNFTFARIQT